MQKNFTKVSGHYNFSTNTDHYSMCIDEIHSSHLILNTGLNLNLKSLFGK
ncbi:MAG: hypothetical protein ACI9L6_000356 [Flavobacterium sp.]|jgi:hypothetical protein